MATKRPGETYRGQALHVPLSLDGQIAVYVWPLRILTIRGQGCGGPTIGVDVGNEEVLRFDCHAAMGHWHGGGYDRLAAPGNSQRPFPESVQSVTEQITWSLQQIQQRITALLKEAQYGAAAHILEPSLIPTAVHAIRTHLEKEGNLRADAIEESLIAT